MWNEIKHIKVEDGKIIIFLIIACICEIVDKIRITNNKRPMFCIDQSGGSIILYIRPGYIIKGAYDDYPGGLENAKIHTWIWFATQPK